MSKPFRVKMSVTVSPSISIFLKGAIEISLPQVFISAPEYPFRLETVKQRIMS